MKKKAQEGQVATYDDSDAGKSKRYMPPNNDEALEDFHTDEEPENFESQKEDMKMYLNKLNKRIDSLVDALKTADSMMAKMGDQNEIIDQINKKKGNKGGATKKND